MKKLFLILSLIASLSLEAQFVTTLAKNVPETQEDGMYYYLPRNVIRLEFTVEETDYYIGPYAEFASKLMGISDYIKENKTEFNVKSVDIQVISELDPNAAYCMSLDEKSKEPLPNIILNNDGVILALGYENISTELMNCGNTFIDNDLHKDKPVISFVDIFDSDFESDDDEEEGSANKKITKEDRAKLALEKLARVRNAYLDLMSGEQEVANGNSLPIMVENIKSIENEYVSLFKGKTVKNTYKKVIYFKPEENQVNATVSIAKLSNTDGIVDNAGKGETIKIQFESKNMQTNINKLSDEVLTASQTNKIFYRIPAKSNVKVIIGNKILTEQMLTISQFGVIRTMSVKNNRVLFDHNTGQIISVIH